MDLPLKGLKVLDLTRALSGPFCTMILADMGAEVIKIEPTPGGDMIRQWGPFDNGISVYYLSANRNKKGVGVDFRHPDGLPLLRRLALQSDILVENFRVGTAEKMGLGYESLAAECPSLIYASISGFGNKGPAKDWPGFDQIAQGYSGFMSLSGTPETGPMRVGTAIGDLTSGMWAAIGVLGACVARQQTGKGQYVHSSLLTSLIGLLSVQGQRYLSLGEVPQPCGNVHPVIAPYGTFQTADGPLNLAPATQEMWVRLCHLLGCPEWTEDTRFKRNADRIQHRLALKELIDARLQTRGRMEWTPLFIEAGIPAGPINTLADVFSDEQVHQMQLVEAVQHPDLGELRQVGLPFLMRNAAGQSSAGATVQSPPPRLGQHTIQVLRQYGVDGGEIDRLLKDQVVFQGADS
ncbi:CaiB/BaiF CoA transferase family protein [Castellaniella sp.]|uniref:CaiB/BaiF CoA transferase family protein n=1 Tax=Castellaniella sp. TaxID=1955812 RepID=UPI003C76B2CB